MGRQEATRQTCLFFHRTGRDDQCASGNQQRVKRKKWEGRKKQFMEEGLKQEGGGGPAGGCGPEGEANQPSWGLESGELGDAAAGSRLAHLQLPRHSGWQEIIGQSPSLHPSPWWYPMLLLLL